MIRSSLDILFDPIWEAQGSNPSLYTTSGLSLLLVRSFALRGFSPLSENKHFQKFQSDYV